MEKSTYQKSWEKARAESEIALFFFAQNDLPPAQDIANATGLTTKQVKDVYMARGSASSFWLVIKALDFEIKKKEAQNDSI